MSIDLIQEVHTAEEFMGMLDQAVNESIQTHANLAATISMLNRTREGDIVKSILEYSIDGYENVTLSYPVDYNKLTDMIEYFINKFEPYCAMPKFSVDQIKYLIDNVFEDLCDPVDMQNKAEGIFRDSEYRGLAVQLRVMVEKGRKLTIDFIVNAEIHADTSDLEYEQATHLGIEETFKPSSPDRIANIYHISASSLDFL